MVLPGRIHELFEKINSSYRWKCTLCQKQARSVKKRKEKKEGKREGKGRVGKGRERKGKEKLRFPEWFFFH